MTAYHNTLTVIDGETLMDKRLPPKYVVIRSWHIAVRYRKISAKITKIEISILKQVKGVFRKRLLHSTSDGRADRICELSGEKTSF